MKKVLALMLCVLTLVPAFCITSTANGENPFTDVEKTAWYYDAVIYSYENGIFKGTNGEGTLFSPDRRMTRAEFTTTLFRIAGANEEDYQGDLPFDDVPCDQWMSAPVKWAAENGIVSGDGKGRFNPNGNLNREQLAVILYNYATSLHDVSEFNESIFDSFADKEDVSSWAVSAVKWMSGIGLLTGTGNNNVSPKMTATRAQAAQILKRYNENCKPAEVVNIGTDRQMFTDDYIVNTEKTDASNEYGTLTKKEALFEFDASWEHTDAVYQNIVQAPDGTYRMYYKGTDYYNKRRICYIESADGITWSRPDTGNGTNIVTPEGYWPDNLFVFYDTNPNCPEDERWKGIYGEWGDGLYLIYSTDDEGNGFFSGKEVKVMKTPAQTRGCYFDSLNTVYWDEARGKYVAFVRGFHYKDNYSLNADFVQAYPEKLVRDVRYSESDDCINWSLPVPLEYSDGNDWQMYTNGVMPYERGNIYVGLPTKFTYSPMTTATLLMTSRDLKNWDRNTDPIITAPNVEHAVHGDCFACVGYIQTAEDELSFYMREWDNSKDCMVLYRYVMRLDGFRSLGSDTDSSTVVTKYLTFEGNSFELNHDGDVKMMIKDTKGDVIFENSFTGDNICDTVDFSDTLDVYKGKLVSITFELDNSRIYSFKFN
ncbi:MAG: S-layer homology domain-containing protein [Clostridia bacterium]|nr:S-layer homology domain-containing protein [Clostridia bacterium]